MLFKFSKNSCQLCVQADNVLYPTMKLVYMHTETKWSYKKHLGIYGNQTHCGQSETPCACIIHLKVKGHLGNIKLLVSAMVSLFSFENFTRNFDWSKLCIMRARTNRWKANPERSQTPCLNCKLPDLTPKWDEERDENIDFPCSLHLTRQLNGTAQQDYEMQVNASTISQHIL